MLNFGLTELRVVDPNCDILSKDAMALAAGAYQILENAKIFTTLKECNADLQRVMATTIRPRDMTQLVLSPLAAAQVAISKDDEDDVKTGIMFGRERSGLTNEEVAMADTIISIPTFKHFSSLNLAQAVNLIGYQMWQRFIEIENTAPPNIWLHPRDGQRLARRDELESLFSRLEMKLDDRNFQGDPNRRELCYRNIRNIFQRGMVTKSEIDLLQGVLTTLTKDMSKEIEE